MAQAILMTKTETTQVTRHGEQIRIVADDIEMHFGTVAADGRLIAGGTTRRQIEEIVEEAGHEAIARFEYQMGTDADSAKTAIIAACDAYVAAS